MPKKIMISIDDWLLKELDKRVKGNRSELISEYIAKGLGFTNYKGGK